MENDGSVCTGNRCGLDVHRDRIKVGARFSVPVLTLPTESTHPHSQWVKAPLAGGVKQRFLRLKFLGLLVEHFTGGSKENHE